MTPPSFRQRLGTFVAARFDRRGYLGLHLTIGFVLSVAAIWIFAKITEVVLNAGAITRFDLRVHDWVRASATPTGYAVFGVITTLGSPQALAIIAAAGAIVELVKRRQVLLLGWVGAFAGAALLDGALKLLVQRPRPPFAMDYLVRKSWSYPSGHSMMSLVCFGMLAYVLCTQRFRAPLARALVVLFAVVMTLLVGSSRVYLGVHYMSDVIAGFVAGIVWLTACISGLEVARRRVSVAAD